MQRWTKQIATGCVLGLMALGMAEQARGQDAPPPPPPGGGGGGGGPGGGGRFDPAQMRQMMLDRMKEQLNASDDEWKAIEPRIEKVMEAQRDTRGAGGMRLGPPGGGRGGPGGGGRGGPPGFGSDPNSPVSKAAEELRSGLDDSNTNPQELAKRLAAYREAREQARAKLTVAQKELKDLLSQRQEAVMLMMGMIE